MMRNITMIAKLSMHPDQIRWCVQSAMNGFDTLDGADAIEHALCEQRSILQYLDALDAADKAVLVRGTEGIEVGVRLEVRVGQADGAQKPKHNVPSEYRRSSSWRQ
jgi:2-keto-3-deoxy-L-rhamnonate aldolase RhmA